MTEVSDWKKIDGENVEIDGLTMSAPQGNYWQKMMGAIARKFEAVEQSMQELEDIVGRMTGDANASTLPTGTDLDDVIQSGHYVCSSTKEYTHLPTGVSNGTLVVYGGTQTEYVKQVFYRYGTLDTNDYETSVRSREYDGSAWSSWKKYAMAS